MIHAEHQSSMLQGDTKSTQSGGLVEGENNEDDEEGRTQEVYETKKKKFNSPTRQLQ